MSGARKRTAQPPESIEAPARAAVKSRKLAPSQVVPPAIAEAPARKAPARKPPARRAAHAEPPAIDAALGAPERAAPPRKAAAAPARKTQPARRAPRKVEGNGSAPVQTTINPNYAWPFAEEERA